MKQFIFLLIIVAGLGNSNAIARTIPGKQVPADTTISYSMEGISSEGAEAAARYIKGRIKECTIRVYGETGQSRIRYVFSKNHITVTERQYTYSAGLAGIQHKNDMQLKKNIAYTTDLKGVCTTAADKERLDIFAAFTDAVPLTLPDVTAP
jgi:hypothetical protein